MYIVVIYSRSSASSYSHARGLGCIHKLRHAPSLLVVLSPPASLQPKEHGRLCLLWYFFSFLSSQQCQRVTEIKSNQKRQEDPAKSWDMHVIGKWGLLACCRAWSNNPAWALWQNEDSDSWFILKRAEKGQFTYNMLPKVPICLIQIHNSHSVFNRRLDSNPIAHLTCSLLFLSILMSIF